MLRYACATTMLRTLTAIAIVVTATIAIVAPASAQQMSAAQIQQMLGGKRVSLSCVDGTTGSGRYTMGRNFGTITGTYSRAGEAPVRDVGRVRASGNQLCLQVQAIPRR